MKSLVLRVAVLLAIAIAVGAAAHRYQIKSHAEESIGDPQPGCRYWPFCG